MDSRTLEYEVHFSVDGDVDSPMVADVECSYMDTSPAGTVSFVDSDDQVVLCLSAQSFKMAILLSADNPINTRKDYDSVSISEEEDSTEEQGEQAGINAEDLEEDLGKL